MILILRLEKKKEKITPQTNTVEDEERSEAKSTIPNLFDQQGYLNPWMEI